MLKAEAPRRRGGRLRNQCGITLVESLIALGLLALGAAVVGDFMTAQIRQSSGNELSTQAYTLAAEELERIRALPFAEMDGESRTEVAGDVTFTIVSVVDDGVPAPNMKSVQATVSWGGPGGAQQIDLRTVYAQVAPD